MSKFISDGGYDSCEFGLHILVHLEDEVDVGSSVATLDGDAQCQLPDLHHAGVDIDAFDDAGDVSLDVLQEVAGNGLQHLGVGLGPFSILPVGEVGRVDAEEQMLHKADLLDASESAYLAVEDDRCPLQNTCLLFH